MTRQPADWRVAGRDRDRAKQLALATGLHPVAIDVLLQRGLQDVDAINRFLHPDLAQLFDPMLLPDMPRAVARIQQAVQRREQIWIYGDYDADGLTATAVLVRFFRDLGLSVRHYIPRRLEEGYGLNAQAVREIADAGADLLITVDCGVNAQAEVALANDLGLTVIVTDHHTPDPARRPAAWALINPKLAESRYPFAELAGVGVALKLVQALGGLAAVARYLELAAIGTIADVVSLTGENRVLAQQGLLALRQPSFPGVAALLATSATDGAVKAGTVSFGLAPRLNAAGRLNQADRALELLLTDDRQLAWSLAELLNRYNQERQAIEQQMLLEAEQAVQQLPEEERWCIVLAQAGWHHGVVGIVAARLAERYHRPVLLLAVEGEEARGSGRSIAGFNLVAGLQTISHLLTAYGGHQAAVGLTLPPEQVPALRAAMNQLVRDSLPADRLTPRLLLDGELDPSEVTMELVRSLEQLGPFGHGHPEPLFCSRRWQLAEARLVGKEGQHLKLRVQGGGIPWEVMAFRRGDQLAEISTAEWLDLAYSVQLNSWNGRDSVVLHLSDWRHAASADCVRVYDRRQDRERGLVIESLLEQPGAVLTVFWPGFAALSWPEFWRSLGVALPLEQLGPVFLRQSSGQWQVVDGQAVVADDQLFCLDVPLGLPSLQRLAVVLERRLYRVGIHLLYNGNDIDRAYKLLETHGPSRQALAALFRALRADSREHWTWSELVTAWQAAGLTLLPDQLMLHLRVMQELALAECACGRTGTSLRLLPTPADKRDLQQSAAYAAASAELVAFDQARGWLPGPDAAPIIARTLEQLISSTGQGDSTQP